MDQSEINSAKEAAKGFLRRKRMHVQAVEFDGALGEFERQIEAGLAGGESSLAMLPTFIRTGGAVAHDTAVLVLDAGGTNFRSTLVRFDAEGKARFEAYTKHPMPGSRGSVGRKEFFDLIAEKAAPLCAHTDSIGFCFSYPTEMQSDRDGRLLHFSKEIKAPEVEGKFIGRGLREALRRAGIDRELRIVILNDTVATLLAAKTAAVHDSFDSYLGFILGTGLNCAYVEENRRIGKLQGSCEGRQIINMESGDFNGIPGGSIDEEFDAGTKSPGRYRLEKMVSGAYLGPLAEKLLTRAAEEGLFSREGAGLIEAAGALDTVAMDAFLHQPVSAKGNTPGPPRTAPHDKSLASIFRKERDRIIAFRLLDTLVERAGRLAALNISAAVLRSGGGTDPSRPAAVCVDGTTFYKTHRLRFYAQYHLKRELEDRRGRYFRLLHVENAPVIGAAVAGLTNRGD